MMRASSRSAAAGSSMLHSTPAQTAASTEASSSGSASARPSSTRTGTGASCAASGPDLDHTPREALDEPTAKGVRPLALRDRGGARQATGEQRVAHLGHPE